MKRIIFLILLAIINQGTEVCSYELINDYSLLIGTGERNYTIEIAGRDFIDRSIASLPIERGKANYLCLKKKGGKKHLSEELVFLWPIEKDTDGDGLSDEKEKELKSDPSKSDTDGDGLSDAEEWVIWGDRSSEDFDGDTIPNIRDFDSLDSGLSDKDNPDIEEVKVNVISDSNRAIAIQDFFNQVIKKKLIKIDPLNSITYSWRPNKERVSGYKIYYRIRGSEVFDGKGILQGDSPINVGKGTLVNDRISFSVSPPNKEAIYEFAIIAYSGAIKSDYSSIITVVAVKEIHEYPNELVKKYSWKNLNSKKVFKPIPKNYQLTNVIVNGKSVGSQGEVKLMIDGVGNTVHFKYH